MSKEKLGVAFIGSGFSAKMHITGFRGIKNGDVVAIYDINLNNAKNLSNYAKEIGLKEPKVYDDLHKLIINPEVNAIWILTPNFTHLDMTKRVVEEITQTNNNIIGLAITKPLARNYSEAKEIYTTVKKSGLLHGYLETEVFMPSVQKGKELVWSFGVKGSDRPYLARGSEEHAGPHSAWFWDPTKSGGGALLDMGGHSMETTRFLLTDPSKPKISLKPKEIYSFIASLKWTKGKYVEDLKKKFGIDYLKSPAEDYSITLVTYEDETGQLVLTEARSAWSYVGSAMRLYYEIWGPEYSFVINTLQPELTLFFSHNLNLSKVTEIVEKQNAIEGNMPVIANEPYTYGYQGVDENVINSFLKNELPYENLDDALFITSLQMLAYYSAEKGQKIRYDISVIENYTPSVSQGRWKP
ncbi:MAG: Gfo/Idh/MocA family protein [Nitrososphaeria archaeon]